MSFADPGFVEHTAKEVIRHQLQKKTREKIDALDEGFLMKQAEGMSKTHAEQMREAKRALVEGLPSRLAAVMAEMGNLDCECRKKIEQGFKKGFESRIQTLEMAEERLNAFMRAKYMDTAKQLSREFRSFTGINAAAFALLAVILLLKPAANIHLLPAALVLLASTGITAYSYLFNQNWLHTLLFNDYAGFAYA